MESFLGIPIEHFQSLFENAPASFLVLLPDEDLTIVGVSENYLQDTLRVREQLIGKPVFHAFPDNPDVPQACATQNLRASIERAIATKAPDIMAVQRYDIPRPDGSGFEVRYWSPINRPVLTREGEVQYIIHRVQNVTDYMLLAEERNLHREEFVQLSDLNRKMEAEIVQRSRELDRTNQELRQANEALKRYADQARNEAQHKDKFLAMLGHELRNPLAGLFSAVELLELVQNDPVKVGQMHEICRRQITNLTVLVDDLLDVSRISRGTMYVRQEPLDLRDVIQSALSTVRAQSERQHLMIDTCVASGSYLMTGDFTRLEQVLANLLTNAVKYSEPGGKIEIGLSVESRNAKEWAVLQVKDHGRGIPPSRLSDIFEMFVQVDPTIDRAGGGLGIGLMLVRKLVEMHGGIVEACSEGPGQGSTFTVRLPLDDNVSMRASPARQENAKASAIERGRVLVIEDNADARETLKSLLELYGYQVEVAADGEEALQRLPKVKPDVAIVDIGLPGLDGFEIARRIRTVPEGSTMKLIALSGYSSADTKTKALNAGFNLHMAKPMDPAELPEILEGSQHTGRASR